MEKYSNWRDKGTGISPFIQSYPKHGIISFAYLILKIPIFVLLIPFIFLPFLVIKHFILRFLFNFQFKPLPLKGHIITNYSSPLLLFLTNLPIYIPQDGSIYYYSPLNFIRHSLNQNNRKIIGIPVEKLDKNCIILIEGTSSNNKCVLKFQSIDKYELDNISTLILKFNPNWVNITLPTSCIWFFVNLLMNGPSSINMKIVKTESVAGALTAFRNAKLRSVNLDLRDKWDFYEYYKNNT